MAKTSVMMRNRILMTHKSQARRSPAKFMNALLCIIGNVDWIDNWLTIRRAPRSSSTAGDRGRLDGAPEEEDRRVLKTPPARAPQAPILTSSNPKNNFRNDAVRRTPRSRRTCRAARPAEAVLRAPDRGARSAGLVARAHPPGSDSRCHPGAEHDLAECRPGARQASKGWALAPFRIAERDARPIAVAYPSGRLLPPEVPDRLELSRLAGAHVPRVAAAPFLPPGGWVAPGIAKPEGAGT